MYDSSSKPYVIYVPGFRSADDPQDKAIQILQTIYPDATNIENFPWENYDSNVISNVMKSIICSLPSPLLHANPFVNLGLKTLNFVTDWGPVTDRWQKALRDVIPTAQLLADKITSLSIEKRENVILVGHSLGANIVVRTLAHLYRKSIAIRQAVLLGAAMDNNAPQILEAVKATSEPVYSMVNPEDLALFIYQQVEGSKALGTGCTLNYDKLRFIERYVPTDLLKTGGHASELYLEQWAKVCGASEESMNSIVNSIIHTLVIGNKPIHSLLSSLDIKKK